MLRIWRRQSHVLGFRIQNALTCYLADILTVGHENTPRHGGSRPTAPKEKFSEFISATPKVRTRLSRPLPGAPNKHPVVMMTRPRTTIADWDKYSVAIVDVTQEIHHSHTVFCIVAT